MKIIPEHNILIPKKIKVGNVKLYYEHPRNPPTIVEITDIFISSVDENDKKYYFKCLLTDKIGVCNENQLFNFS